LGRNQLTSLPSEIGQLTNLHALDLFQNEIASLPDEIGSLSSLLLLAIGSNKMTTIPEVVGTLSTLTGLDFASNQLTSIPTFIGSLSNLSLLEFFNNQLVSIPPEIGNLSELVHLFLGENQLSSLPSEIQQLAKLEILVLRRNYFTTFPVEIYSLPSPLVVDFSENMLTSISNPTAPSTITDLNLDNNQLKALFSDITMFPALTRLSFNYNMVYRIPSFLKSQPSFDVSGNNNFFKCSLPSWASQGQLGTCIESYCRSSDDCSQTEYCKKPLGNCKGRGVCSAVIPNCLSLISVEACTCSLEVIADSRCPVGKNLKSLYAC